KKNVLAELIHQKNELVNSFNTLASNTYEAFELPTFTLIEDKTYMENNLNVLKTKEDMSSKNHFSIMTITKYLPTINFTYDYTKYHDYDNDLTINENRELMGLNLTIPFDFRTINDIQSSRIDYLKSRISLNNTILEEENFYKTALSKIQMIESKKSIANEDYALYTSLLEDITQAAQAGLNSYADVQTLDNSKEIKSFDIQILELERQIELLELYAKIATTQS
ncbi:MAG: TolC family protein, partial [Deltaproteobacteria bacterium HGW-Deltaproteobacteria-24]